VCYNSCPSKLLKCNFEISGQSVCFTSTKETRLAQVLFVCKLTHSFVIRSSPLSGRLTTDFVYLAVPSAIPYKRSMSANVANVHYWNSPYDEFFRERQDQRMRAAFLHDCATSRSPEIVYMVAMIANALRRRKMVLQTIFNIDHI
jgi:hypothetical protein